MNRTQTEIEKLLSKPLDSDDDQITTLFFEDYIERVNDLVKRKQYLAASKLSEGLTNVIPKLVNTLSPDNLLDAIKIIEPSPTMVCSILSSQQPDALKLLMCQLYFSDPINVRDFCHADITAQVVVSIKRSKRLLSAFAESLIYSIIEVFEIEQSHPNDFTYEIQALNSLLGLSQKIKPLLHLIGSIEQKIVGSPIAKHLAEPLSIELASKFKNEGYPSIAELIARNCTFGKDADLFIIKESEFGVDINPNQIVKAGDSGKSAAIKYLLWKGGDEKLFSGLDLGAELDDFKYFLRICCDYDPDVAISVGRFVLLSLPNNAVDFISALNQFREVLRPDSADIDRLLVSQISDSSHINDLERLIDYALTHGININERDIPSFPSANPGDIFRILEIASNGNAEDQMIRAIYGYDYLIGVICEALSSASAKREWIFNAIPDKWVNDHAILRKHRLSYELDL